MEIVEFLEACLADDEAVVWPIVDDIGGHYDGPFDERESGYVTIGAGRVLREVASKRAILAEHAPVNTHQPLGPDCCRCGVRVDTEYDGDVFGAVDSPCPTVRALASVYVDHPDFDPAWAVEAAVTT